ncbi:amidohydrolase [uncultured Ruegeria sp.]|uniref:amidohydrolase n=1 Tax=uncultured Ruegeria sp. TaxID=259304 RepID=UPI00260D33CB|nr:amidohydrolase [uncultured Ruegeria sp.]
MTPETVKRLTALRRELHQSPEVSGQEQKTAERIAELMRNAGADLVLTGLGGHGVVAVFDSGIDGPGIGIRCELDALPIQEESDFPYTSCIPGKGHLCGHDGHMAMVVGAAEALGIARPQTGRVVLIFQPSEETGKGAAAVRSDPRFSDIAPDYVFALHNLPGLDLGIVEICDGPANCASRGMRIVLTGKTSHAAAPQDGISPAAALSKLMPALTKLGQGGPLDQNYALTTVTHASLGEQTFGVAPGRAELWVTLRTVRDTRMAELIAEAEALVAKTSQAEGVSSEVTYDDVFEACANHTDAVNFLNQACVERNVPVRLVNEPQRFSEDFGQFGENAKTAMFWLGSGSDHPQLHNPDYDFPDALIPIGTGVFLAVIRRILG